MIISKILYLEYKKTDVRIQIYPAITAYCMATIVEHDLKCKGVLMKC